MQLWVPWDLDNFDLPVGKGESLVHKIRPENIPDRNATPHRLNWWLFQTTPPLCAEFLPIWHSRKFASRIFVPTPCTSGWQIPIVCLFQSTRWFFGTIALFFATPFGLDTWKKEFGLFHLGCKGCSHAKNAEKGRNEEISDTSIASTKWHFYRNFPL